MARIAVVDLGTNSTRLLIADVRDGVVAELDRRTQITRLGEGVDSSGRLAPAAMERVFETLEGFRAAIDERGADRVEAVATSAVRDAANGEEFREALHERFLLAVRTISGDEEARLTFLGATSARAREDGTPTLVIDIGGGSTEFVVGVAGAAPDFHVSTQSGSVRQTERHLPDDPPTHDQVAELRREVRAIIDGSVPAEVRDRVTQAIAVAGTATSLAAVDQRLDPYDPARVDGYRLTLDACERMLDQLVSVPLSERRKIVGLNPARAPTIVAGAAILVEGIRAFGLDGVETSEADILHGVALTASV